jgi:hypothetical protein
MTWRLRSKTARIVHGVSSGGALETTRHTVRGPMRAAPKAPIPITQAERIALGPFAQSGVRRSPPSGPYRHRWAGPSATWAVVTRQVVALGRSPSPIHHRGTRRRPPGSLETTARDPAPLGPQAKLQHTLQPPFGRRTNANHHRARPEANPHMPGSGPAPIRSHRRDPGVAKLTQRTRTTPFPSATTRWCMSCGAMRAVSRRRGPGRSNWFVR